MPRKSRPPVLLSDEQRLRSSNDELLPADSAQGAMQRVGETPATTTATHHYRRLGYRTAGLDVILGSAFVEWAKEQTQVALDTKSGAIFERTFTAAGYEERFSSDVARVRATEARSAVPPAYLRAVEGVAAAVLGDLQRAGVGDTSSLRLRAWQLSSCGPCVQRAFHQDKLRIGDVIATITISGEGLVELRPAPGVRDMRSTSFRQSAGDHYVLYRHGLHRMQHQVTAGASDRISITFRFLHKDKTGDWRGEPWPSDRVGAS